MDNNLEQVRATWMKPHEYLLIQAEMLAEDDAWIQDQLMSTEAGKQLAAKNMNFKLQLGSVKLATAKRMIKGWNITRTIKQPDGSSIEVPLPYSIENIGKLPKAYMDFAVKEINARNPDMDEQEQQDFLPPASQVIEAPSQEQ